MEEPLTLEQRIAALEGTVNDVVEGGAEMKSVVDVLGRTKLTAYAQGRFEWHADSVEGLNGALKPSETTQFLLRRGRIKAVWAFGVAELLMQLDATPKGVVLKDAEATIVEPSTNQYLRITGGQFKWPFGYEVLQSSEFRQMPERARVIRALFPGERDRGFRVQAWYDWFRFAAAIVNGNGTEDAIYGASDSNLFKDVLGRAAFDVDWFVFGVSGYYGKATKTTIAGTTASYQKFTRARVGADLQLYLDVPALGGLGIKGEIIGGAELGATPLGFWIFVTQNFGPDFSVFARYDYYDPNLDAASAKISTIGGGAQYFFNGYVKASATWEHPTTIAANAEDPDDDVFTLQLQASFF